MDGLMLDNSFSSLMPANKGEQENDTTVEGIDEEGKVARQEA